MFRQEFHRSWALTLLLFGGFCLAPRLVSAQTVPNPPASGARIADFVPKGWEILMQAEGDLNRDGKPDAALALKNSKEESSNEEVPRLLVLLLQNPDGTYRLASKSAEAILCRSCGGVFGDPLAELQIKSGVLIIDHYAGSRQRWSYTHRWRFQDGDWVLIGETKTSFDAIGPEAKSDDMNLLTGDRVLEITDINGKVKVTKSKLPKQPLKKLSTFKFS
ncbi:MAG TPA: hypothetical protein VJP40_04255 [bacterium]|nr:hypothetical protein [bacterium]